MLKDHKMFTITMQNTYHNLNKNKKKKLSKRYYNYRDKIVYTKIYFIFMQ